MARRKNIAIAGKATRRGDTQKTNRPSSQAAECCHREEALAQPDGLSFHVCQAFVPCTAAWDSLKRALKGEYKDRVWAHLDGDVSVPFQVGEHGQIAVKVIDDRGNELMVVRSLKEAV